MFFMIVATLFPLTLTPELSRLRDAAPGVLWVGALLSSLLALEFLFREDALDGTLEQFALSGQSLTWMLFAKTCTHWLLTGLPLALAAPVAAAALGVPAQAMPGLVASLLLGSFALSLVGAISAGLTLGARRGGVLLSLLTLPLAVPILIFGARATQRAIAGEDYRAADVLVRRDRGARHHARAARRRRGGAYRTGVEAWQWQLDLVSSSRIAAVRLCASRGAGRRGSAASRRSRCW